MTRSTVVVGALLLLIYSNKSEWVQSQTHILGPVVGVRLYQNTNNRREHRVVLIGTCIWRNMPNIAKMLGCRLKKKSIRMHK